MDNLSIISASAINQAKLQNQVDFAVAGKTLQVQKQQGAAVVQLIEQAAQVQQQLNDGQLDVTL